MKVIITGVAGFIGFHTAKYFYEHGVDIVGIDNIGTDNVEIKKQRLAQLPDIEFHKADITDASAIEPIFAQAGTDILAVIHLAAKAGVRDSFDNAEAYVHNNINGFNVVIEAARKYAKNVPFVYASSSSVYGDEDMPKSPYGVTKVTNELMANVYSDTYGMVTTGLRFFTVYGEWMRPDLAIYKFTKSIMDGEKIRLYNRGDNYRDYTYVSDAVQAIELAIARDANSRDEMAVAFDIGTGMPTQTAALVDEMEKIIGKKTVKWLDMPKKGDSLLTCADVDDSQDGIGYYPTISLQIGLMKFIEWYTLYDDHTLEENQD